MIAAQLCDSSPDPTAPRNRPPSYFHEGKDIWHRARTNALAHRITAERLERLGLILALLQNLLTVIAIVAISLALHYVTSGQTNSLPMGLTFTRLVLVAIFANGIALFIGLIAKDLKFSERALQHRTLLSSYSIIAQKARRLASGKLDDPEARHLVRHLQETFEIYKSSGIFEPPHWALEKAQEILPQLKPLPFDLDGADGPGEAS